MMVRGRLAVVAIVGGIAAAVSAPASASVPTCGTGGVASVSGTDAVCTYSPTGAEDVFIVPPGVSTVDVDAIGAAGAPSYGGPPAPPGGRGAKVTSQLSGLSSAETLFVEVGGAPTGSGCFLTVDCVGGFNGGGSSYFGGGGGGASDVRTIAAADAGSLDSRLLVAAGGGGGGVPGGGGCDDSGTAGGDAGAAGQTSSCPGIGTSTGGGPGETSASSNAGSPFGNDGTQGQGGAGGENTGGGGGGGLFGGGGGGDIVFSAVSGNTAGGGGGGGSSLIPGAGSAQLSSGTASIVISWPLPDVTVSNNPTTGGTFSGGPIDTFTPDAAGANVNVADLVSHLGSNNVQIGDPQTTGNVTIENDISSNALHELDFDAAGAINIDTASVSTLAAQGYEAPVTLGVDTTLTSSGQSVVLVKTVDGAHALSIGGDAQIFGAIGSTTALSKLSAAGHTQLETNAITTTGAQHYTGAVTLAADATVSSNAAGDISFDSTINGAQALTVDTGGTTTFSGGVGATTALASLTTDAPGSTAIDGASIVTSGTQTYHDPVTLGSNATLTSGTGDVTFGSTVNGAHSLSTSTSAGTTTFSGAVGETTALSSVSVPGAATLNGGTVTTTGAQAYGAATLGANTSLTSTVNAITFNGTVDGAFSLTTNTDGVVTLGGAVGSQTALTSVTIDGPLDLNGGAVSTSGASGQLYNGQVTLGADTTVTAANAGAVDFGSQLDGAFALTIDTSGTTMLAIAGATTPLASLTTDAGGSTLAEDAVHTAGDQSYGDATITDAIGQAFTSTGGSVTFHSTLDELLGGKPLEISAPTMITLDGAVGASGTPPGSFTLTGPSTIGANVTSHLGQEYTGPVTLADDVTLTSTISGGIAFESTINGAFGLTVSSTGTASLGGAVGGDTPLASFTLSGGSLDVNGSGISTTGDQSYGANPVVVGAPATLTSPQVMSTGTATLSHDLTVDGGGSLTGAISGAGKLTKTGSGTLTLGGSNGYGGGTDVTGGLLAFSGPGSFGTGNVTVDGGGLRWASNTADISSQLNAIGAGGATFDTNGHDVTFANALTGGGPITKTGAGKLTLAAVSTANGAVDVTGGTLGVTGTVPGHVTVESTGALACTAGGTLSGGLTNNGGTATAVPDAPTGVSAVAGDGSATVTFTPGASNCLPAGPYTVTASPGGAHASGAGSPITVNGLTDHTSYTFTVTTSNVIGSSAASTPSTAVSPESGPPAAHIASPADGAKVNVDQAVAPSFTCTEASGGPGIASCAGGAQLDTSHAGTFAYTVTATSKDGQTATTSIHYTVLGQPTITVNRPTTGGRYTADQHIAVGYACTDDPNGPGISSCTGTAPSGSALNTKTIGRHTFTVTATSGDGLTSTRTVTYRVVLPNSKFKVFGIHPHANGDISFKVTIPGPGVVNVLETAWLTNEAHAATLLPPARGRFVYSRDHRVAAGKGTLSFTVHPNARGLRLVAHHTYPVILRLWVTFQPTHGVQHKLGFRGIHLGT
jgi:autotransporter-associated beta strand protein